MMILLRLGNMFLRVMMDFLNDVFMVLVCFVDVCV